MARVTVFRFGPFVVDTADERLIRGDQAMALAPSA